MPVYTPNTPAAAQHHTREAWLVAARDILTNERFTPTGLTLPKTRVSVGFPDGNLNKVIGQCWADHASADGTREVFISPVLADPAGSHGVLATLVHELLHAALPHTVGHRGRFITGMRSLGLVGKPTATSASPELADWFTSSLLPRLGAYPHAKLTRTSRRPAQRNRHRKYQCPGCEQIIRAATRDLDVVCRPCDTPFEPAD